MKAQLSEIDPQLLGIHPIAASLPSVCKDDADLKALASDIFEAGLLTPLLCIPETTQHGARLLVIDGRRRLLAAKQLQMEKVPIQIHSQEDSLWIVLTTLCHRKHHSKGALAYLAYKFLEPFWREWDQKRLQNLKKTQCFPESALSAPTGPPMEQAAARFGISPRLLDMAAAVHKAFSSDKRPYDFPTATGVEALTLREYFEPKLLATPIGDEHGDAEFPRYMGLAAVLKGIAAKQSAKTTAQSQPKAVELLCRVWDDLSHRFTHWGQLAAPEQAEVWKSYREAMRQAPDTFWTAIPTQIKLVRKLRKKKASLQ